jgi:hypothetical protein
VTRVDFRWNVDNENPKKLQISRWRIWCEESTSESHLLLGFEKNGTVVPLLMHRAGS